MPKESTYQPTNQEKLDFYGLFKQGTEGPCNTKAPSRLKIVDKAKWDAWNSLGKKTKEEAMKIYVGKISAIAKKMKTKESELFLKEINPPPTSKM